MISTSDIESLHNNWNCLVLDYSQSLAETYKLVHQAIQFLAITGKAYLPPRYDDSHTSFSWDYLSQCFTTEWLQAKRTFRIEFDPVNLAFSLVPYDEMQAETIQIEGRTKKEVYALLRDMLLSEGIKGHRIDYEMHYDLPEHVVCKGGKYEILDTKLNKELAKHYSNASLVLNLLKAKYSMENNIRCWPHHFDMTADYSETEKNGDTISRFSMGFSPANSDYQEPHFCFTRNSNSKVNRKEKVKLKNGKWLPGKLLSTSMGINMLVKKSNSRGQVETLSGFINESIAVLMSHD